MSRFDSYSDHFLFTEIYKGDKIMSREAVVLIAIIYLMVGLMIVYGSYYVRKRRCEKNWQNI